MHQFVNKNYKQIIGLISHFVTPSILNQEEGARLQFSREGAAGDE